ncbi:MAG: chromosomal replication initiator protein DnaA [Eubacteriales bacterium]|nr:chromosomal replication initiator protein DnaA [Eubacteriales bacterium]
MEELKQKWELILNTLKEEYDIQDISFKTWIKPLKLYSVEGNKIILLISEETMGISYIEKKYLIPLKVTISEIMGQEYEVELISEKDKQAADLKKIKNSNKTNPASNVLQNLNPNYTFNTFVVGNNNNLAHAASLAVAETPGEVYNPLFIYGGVGLGKTHLMQAIAHFIIANDPSKKVLYVTSETFTNELIDSVKNNKNSEFRNKYRNIDVLLIDDIQFIIGKESTQEEFFHTFNALYQDSKQIVISSDRPPKEMETLTERLRTRFEMGLPVDIQIPTYETKMAILNKKAELGGYDIPNEVKDYVATHIKSSIRELEGALTKLSAFSTLSHSPITVEFAEETLKDLISPDAKKEVTLELIVQIVADHFNISPDDILSQKRQADIVKPRQISMYLCRQMTTTPLQAIGKYIGNRDHTTVIHGADKIAKEVLTNEATKNTIDILIKKINPS